MMREETLEHRGFRPPAAGWVVTLAVVCAVLAVGSTRSAMERVVLMVGGMLLGFKLITLPSRRALTYLFLWPGMNPRPFEVEGRPNTSQVPLIALGLVKMASGVVALAAATNPALPELARAWIAIAGFLLVIHLGLFDVVAALWRLAGVPVERICPEPWLSKSVSEFWAARWNMAFHFFARDQVYRPLARRWGRAPAVLAVFLFSGLAHEMVISFPAGAGWGLPTLYFILQGLVVHLEKKGVWKGRRLATAAWILLPAPLLFHPSFLRSVILPMVSL